MVDVHFRQIQRAEIYVMVEVTLKRLAYRGQRSIDPLTVRLVRLQNETTYKYHYYPTHLFDDPFSPLLVATLYRTRQYIELLFHELKSTIDPK